MNPFRVNAMRPFASSIGRGVSAHAIRRAGFRAHAPRYLRLLRDTTGSRTEEWHDGIAPMYEKFIDASMDDALDQRIFREFYGLVPMAPESGFTIDEIRDRLRSEGLGFKSGAVRKRLVKCRTRLSKIMLAYMRKTDRLPDPIKSLPGPHVRPAVAAIPREGFEADLANDRLMRVIRTAGR